MIQQKNFSSLRACVLLLVGFGFSQTSSALDIPDRSFSESTPNPENFPVTGFSFEACSSRIPVKKNQNPWLRIEKKKSKPAAMNPEPASWTESYYVTPANKAKQFSIVNQEDSIYNAPTTLARIDCKNGLIYFQHLVREPVTTNFHRVFDLVSGVEYKVTEGAVTFSPDGKHLLTASASDQDQKCSYRDSCAVGLKFYSCKGRKTQQNECQLVKEYDYLIHVKGRRPAFSPVPVKWKEKRKDVKVILGGSKQSPAKIICDVTPELNCKISSPGKIVVTEK